MRWRWSRPNRGRGCDGREWAPHAQAPTPDLHRFLVREARDAGRKYFVAGETALDADADTDDAGGIRARRADGRSRHDPPTVYRSDDRREDVRRRRRARQRPLP